MKLSGGALCAAVALATAKPRTQAIKFVINPQFDGVMSFADGLAPVRIGDDKTGKWGFIDKQGKFVINPQYDDANQFIEGLARIRIGDYETGKRGYINKQGGIVIEPQFIGALNFVDGLARVEIGLSADTGKYGFIDKQGKFVINAQFDDADDFFEGLAPVRIGDDKTGKYGFIDKQGTRIVDKQGQSGLRLSYATRSGTTVTALVQLVATEPFDGVRGFSLGYAVPEQYRRRGLGKAGVIAGLAEFDKAFAGRLGRYFIEAVVGTDNIASQRIAQSVLGGKPQSGRDSVSGLLALRYVRQFSYGSFRFADGIGEARARGRA